MLKIKKVKVGVILLAVSASCLMGSSFGVDCYNGTINGTGNITLGTNNSSVSVNLCNDSSATFNVMAIC